MDEDFLDEDFCKVTGSWWTFVRDGSFFSFFVCSASFPLAQQVVGDYVCRCVGVETTIIRRDFQAQGAYVDVSCGVPCLVAQ